MEYKKENEIRNWDKRMNDKTNYLFWCIVNFTLAIRSLVKTYVDYQF